ncbi:hypothetical protein BD769DRAFT_1682300 [Suillus cothurnatus]|nr:hypothetical protein BD769DRAFT_1682300 [Suillus cothurnatus]
MTQPNSHQWPKHNIFVYNAGFINRMGDASSSIYADYRPYSTSTNLTPSKGWNAAKAEHKGSKLYFYKVPSDRSAAIKELFATKIVPTLKEGAELTVQVAVRNVHIGVEEPILTYRIRHDSLQPSAEGEEQGASTGKPRRPKWEDLCSAVLLCLPILVGRESFENEFTRLCDNLVSGADEKSKDYERSKRCPLFSRNEGSASGIPKSTSMPAVFAPSPNPGMYSPSITGFYSLQTQDCNPSHPPFSISPQFPQHPFADPKQRVWGRKGLFRPFFWSHSMSTLHTPCHPLTPLLFADPLPAVTLLDGGQIWHGRLEPAREWIDEAQADASSSKDKLFNIGTTSTSETAIPVYDENFSSLLAAT